MKNLLSLCLLLTSSAFAQEEPVSDMYWNNYSHYNPAMSAVDQKHEANVSYKFQPNDFYTPSSLFANYGINLKGKHGLGLNYVNEQFGFFQVNRIKLNYNYQFKLKEGRRLSVGTSLGFSRFTMSPNWNCPVCDYHLFYIVPQNNIQLDLGAAYYGRNIIAGLSETQIPIYESFDHFRSTPHLIMNFRYQGAVFSLPSFILETKLQTDFQRYQQDFNIGYNIKDFLEVGVGYRTTETVLINMTGIIKERFRVGYSFGQPLSQSSGSRRNIHEFTLGLRLGSLKN